MDDEYIMLNGPPRIFFCFSDEQIGRLREVLAGYDEEKIESAIDGFNFVCSMFQYVYSPSDSKLREHREQLADMKKSLESTQKHLCAIHQYRFDLLPPVPRIFDANGGRDCMDTNEKAAEAASRADESLTMLMDKIEQAEHLLNEAKPSRGQNTPLSHKVIKELAIMFSKHLAAPTTYRNGPFCNVVRIILETLNLPCENPTRGVLKALKEVNLT